MALETTTRFDVKLRRLGISQTRIAGDTGIPRGVVNEIATGTRRPKMGRAMALADAIGWPAERVSDLFEVIPCALVGVIPAEVCDAGDDRA